MARILVCIDDSGTPVATEKLFSCGAVWCAPITETGCQEPLRYTVDHIRRRISEELRCPIPREISHHDHEKVAASLFVEGYGVVMQDKSIRKSDHPWDTHPLAFSKVNYNPQTEMKIYPELTDEELGNQMRVRAVANLLRPLTLFSGDEQLDVTVILDDHVWKKAVDVYDPDLQESISNAKINQTVDYGKSSSVPGLQIADLVAGINRHYLMTTDGKTAYRTIESSELHRIRGFRGRRIDHF